MIDASKPVALRRDPRYTGRVHGAILNGLVYVRWDAGGGHSVHEQDLVQEGHPMSEQQTPHQPEATEPESAPEDTEHPKGQDKSWPPKNIEQKTPKVDTK